MIVNDSDIIKGLVTGDKRIFDLIFKNYYPGLCVFARDYLRSSEAAQEIVQEVFLYIWENRENIQIRSSLKAYLYKSVHNRCINYIRDNTSISHKGIKIEELKKHSDLLLLEISDTTFDISFSEQIEEELSAAIESLPEQCKTIFRLSRFQNLSYPEISTRLNVSLSTVKTQMSRAMNDLYKRMKKYL